MSSDMHANYENYELFKQSIYIYIFESYDNIHIQIKYFDET